jgi:hypothetical protein
MKQTSATNVSEEWAPFTKAGARFEIHPDTVARYVARYHLRVQWIGNRRLVNIQALEQILTQPPAERPK